MKKRALLTLLSVTALTTAFLTPAHADQDVLAQVKQAGVLKVGTETAFAPFDFIKEGTHTGLNVDLFQEIGKELGVKIEWVLLPWEGVLPGLEVNKFDMVGGPAMITKARLERYRFSSPVAESTVGLLKRKNNDALSKSSDIAGKTVGVSKGTAQLAQLKAYSDTLPGKVTIREYPGNNEAYADLANGRITAVANSLPNIAFVAKERPEIFALVNPPFGTKAYFGYIMRKDGGSASLVSAVNTAILKMKADGRLAAMQKKWFGTEFATPDSVDRPDI